MANIVTPELVAFCGKDNTKFYEQFADYHFHKSDAEWNRKLGAYDASVSLSEKHDKVNEAFFAEIERLSGVSRANDSWMAHPATKWACMSIVNAVVNAVLPAYVTASLAPFVDFKTVGFGDVVTVKVQPRTLYTVSKGAHGERVTFRQKKYAGNVTIAPVEHTITTYVDMFRVLAGKEDLADAIRAIVLSIEIDMNKEAVAALNAGLANINAAFKTTGAFATTSAIQLGQKVQAYNNGVKPVIMGTAAALANVLPSSTAGFRQVVDGVNGSVKYLSDFYGFDLYELPQMPKGDASYSVVLDDTKLYFISPSVNKLVTGVMSTALTNSNDFYENADLTQNFTMRKAYGFEFVGGAFAGVYTIQ